MSKLRWTLHWRTNLPSDESTWSISFRVNPSLETQEKRWMSLLWNQEPAMLRWCALQNDSRRSVFAFGDPWAYYCIAWWPPGASDCIEITKDHLEVILSTICDGDFRLYIKFLLNWPVCLLCRSICDDDLQMPSSVVGPCTQYSLVNWNPGDTCRHQLHLYCQRNSLLVAAISPSRPEAYDVSKHLPLH